ncbi:MAG: MotA/TolQ/ExbB proton channel family protein [Elusimicrobiales bacterium]|nr:MotA/TolQ/ExbB proton channel family protein [Elusimicrobiales bacterium]
MDIMTIGGFLLGAAVVFWGIFTSGIADKLMDLHGIVIVLGGTLAATVINTSFKRFVTGLKAFVDIFYAPKTPSVDSAVRMLVGMAETAQKQGGIMALTNTDPAFAGGFLKRAVGVAMISAESRETRAILEEEIRRRRLDVQEDSNFYRTMSVLSPMFGLIGTLFGIIQTLSNISDPTMIGRSMAVAISSAFFGIGLSNLVFVPVANKVRLRAVEETLVLQLILEGVIDIMSGKTPHLVEMHLRGYQLIEGASQAGGRAARA